jgi:microcystin-dependent protein
MWPCMFKSKKWTIVAAIAGALTLGVVAYAETALEITPEGSVKVKSLDFGTGRGQFLNAADLDPTSVNEVGWGVQEWTAYQRTPAIFAWFNGGKHSDTQLDPGEGGKILMWLKQPLASDTVNVPKARADVVGVLQAGEIRGKGAVPVGAIMMWSGKVDDIPKGWVLCDGLNGAPDLSGRFIVGYSKSKPEYDIGKTGGQDSVTLAIDNMPTHNHSVNVQEGLDRKKVSGTGAFSESTYGYAKAGIDADAAVLTHTFVSNMAGGGNAFDNRPSYYTLAYIMYKG